MLHFLYIGFDPRPHQKEKLLFEGFRLVFWFFELDYGLIFFKSDWVVNHSREVCYGLLSYHEIHFLRLLFYCVACMGAYVSSVFDLRDYYCFDSCVEAYVSIIFDLRDDYYCDNWVGIGIGMFEHYLPLLLLWCPKRGLKWYF